MTDKDKIKFAIRYLKKGLKSKRTPPLYEELMNELGFEKKDKVNNLISVAEVRLANWQKYAEENKELKEEIAELKEKVKWYSEQVCCKECAEVWRKAKEHIRTLISCLINWIQEGDKDYCYVSEAEQFLNEVEK